MADTEASNAIGAPLSIFDNCLIDERGLTRKGQRVEAVVEELAQELGVELVTFRSRQLVLLPRFRVQELKLARRLPRKWKKKKK